MSRMSRRSWSSRLALWAAGAALLLKAAVPMLAAAAAEARGVPVAEVCSVYGVALPGASHGGHGGHDEDAHAGHAHHHAEPSGHEDHSRHSTAAHSGDHCALTALAALAVPETVMPAVMAARHVTADLPAAPCAGLRDACAAWVARLKHGPPAALS
jgi:hypothetical protein